MTFTFATFYTFLNISAILVICQTLQVFKSSGVFVLCIHLIITAECGRNVDSFWTWHAVATCRTTHFGFLFDLFLDLFDQGEIFTRKIVLLRI